jgi:hypothetical protein
LAPIYVSAALFNPGTKKGTKMQMQIKLVALLDVLLSIVAPGSRNGVFLAQWELPAN